jgi:hypothetical protein
VRHVRMLGLCLVAALALGAYAVSSASALEWGQCEYVGSGGNYTGPNCKAHAEIVGEEEIPAEKAKPKGSGEYEWHKASEVAERRVAEGKTANVPFSGHSIEGGGVLSSSARECAKAGSSPRVTRERCRELIAKEEGYKEKLLYKSEPAKIECASESNSGETVAKNKVENVHVTFAGCNLFGYLPCTSEGRSEGEVETKTLKGKLGWINKAAKEVGLLLEPQNRGPFAAFECSGPLAVVVGAGNKKEGTEYVQGENYPEGCFGATTAKEPEGGCPLATPAEEKHGGYHGVISPITPVNQMTSEFTQVFTEEAEYPHRNLPTHLEKKHISVLEDYQEVLPEIGWEWSAAGEVITNVNVPEEAGEIKA